MGACLNKEANLSKEERAKLKEEREKSKALEKTMARDHNEDRLIHKLLLLGAGESGKSTLFKQMITLYGKGFSEADRKSYVGTIMNNALSSIQTLANQSGLLADRGFPTQVRPDVMHIKQHILETRPGEPITAALAAEIKTLWADEGIKAAYENRAKFQLIDCAQYFLDKVDTIATPGWIPDQQDVLRCRVRTTGIVENHFDIGGNQFKMFDVGGQRNERKKWIHCFSEVTAVLFVVDISAYDQVLFEDESTNRIHEALNLFEEIANLHWFSKSSMILMLNKRDVFAEKIYKVPLTVCFPDYDGPNDYESGCTLMRSEFEARNHTGKVMYSHITCATDTDNVRAVFDAVKDTVIRRSLEEGGLLAA